VSVVYIASVLSDICGCDSLTEKWRLYGLYSIRGVPVLLLADGTVVPECAKVIGLAGLTSDWILRAPMASSEAVDLILAICAGVAACHRHGTVHRDRPIAAYWAWANK
jgi:serine/threonine protein kinase